MPFKDRNFAAGAITAAKFASLTNAVDSTNLGDDVITADHIAASAVTIAKLNTTLKTGYIPLDISTARIIAAGVIQNTSEGGVPDTNTDPSIARINGATDKAMRVTWAAGSVVVLAFAPFALPPDIDSTAVLSIKVRASMAGASDTPTLGLTYFEAVGDTNAGGNTAAVTGTTPATYSVSVLATDVGSAGSPVAISLTPAAHGTDALRLDAAWVEYTRV